MTIREVWRYNLHSELLDFGVFIQSFPVISFDTEFPGFLRKTRRRGASEETTYADLKHNVDSLKLIQLGITLSNGIDDQFVTFQFNFSDFDYENDIHDPEAIDLLQRNGIDFEKTKKDGIVADEFRSEIRKILGANYKNISWVTFHGLYDFGYVLKLLTGNPSLPSTLFEFTQSCAIFFGNRTYDLKYMSGYFDEVLRGELGLSKLAEILNIERVGNAHQAGSDSLVTAMAFSKMIKWFGQRRDLCQGFLYGISFRLHRPCLVVVRPPCLPRYCLPHQVLRQQQMPCPPYFPLPNNSFNGVWHLPAQ